MEITRELIKKYLPEADITAKLGGGWWVSTQAGEIAEISLDGCKKMYGGHEFYRAIILLVAEANGGRIGVEGPASHIAAVIAHGEAMGVTVIPKVSSGAPIGFLSFLIFLLVFTVTIPFVSFWVAIIIGCTAFSIASWLMHSRDERDALERGQSLRNSFPPVHRSGPRKADREETRKKVWL